MNESEKTKLSQSLKANMETVKTIYGSDSTLKMRSFSNLESDKIKCGIFYIEGLVNKESISKNIIRPIIQAEYSGEKDIPALLKDKVITSEHIRVEQDLTALIEAVNYGDTALFIDGFATAFLIDSKDWKQRQIEEPQSEMTVRGPKEGFTECIMVNLSLIRRRIITQDLKYEFSEIGTRTKTKICMCYIEGVANKNILGELKDRLSKINMDAVLDSGYIQECIKDAPMSIFKTVGSTEKPDIICGKLLEGRIAIVVDGSPEVITVPYLFIEAFQTGEDYYIPSVYGSINRFLRIASFFLTTMIPANYIALVTFHQEMIPTPLAISIAAASTGTPFPTIVEMALMLIVFEIIREAIVRMPSFMGQAISIVGVLVIGQATVEARFISAPIIIIVAFTAITGLMIGKIKSTSIILRMIFIILSGFLGFYGIIFGFIVTCIYLLQLKSFGVPFIHVDNSKGLHGVTDTIIRAPWWYLKLRPAFMAIDRKRNDFKTKKVRK